MPSPQDHLPDIASIPADLTLPPLTEGPPRAGARVLQTTPGWEGTSVHHVLSLPTDWMAGRTYPVLAEYPGNVFESPWGDVCLGTVEDTRLGYGLSGGEGVIGLSLPFIKGTGAARRNEVMWWGSPDETAAYALATVGEVCARWGGDSRNVILGGFSRGSIAVNYIGLRDDRIAPLWKAFLCSSHYDGVYRWPYPESDLASSRARLARLSGRPQFLILEGEQTTLTRRYLEESGVEAPLTLVDFPYLNHTDQWALRDCPLRRQARAWLAEVLARRIPFSIAPKSLI